MNHHLMSTPRNFVETALKQPDAPPPNFLGIVTNMVGTSEQQHERIRQVADRLGGAILDEHAQILWIDAPDGEPTTHFIGAYNFIESGRVNKTELPEHPMIKKKWTARKIEELGFAEYKEVMRRKLSAEAHSAFPSGEIEYVRALDLLDGSLVSFRSSHGLMPEEHREGAALLMADMMEGIRPDAETRIDIDDNGSVSSVKVRVAGNVVELLGPVRRVVSNPEANYLPQKFGMAVREVVPQQEPIENIWSVLATAPIPVPAVRVESFNEVLNSRTLHKTRG